MAKKQTYRAFTARPSHILDLNGELLDGARVLVSLASEVRDISSYATYVVRNDEAQGDLSAHIRYWGDCTVEQQYDEWDETYLTHLQRLYDIDRLPWPTKTVLALRRSK